MSRGHQEILNHQWRPGVRHGKIPILRLCIYAVLPMLTEDRSAYAARAQNFKACGIGRGPFGIRSCGLWSKNKTTSSYRLLPVLNALCRLPGDHGKLAEVRLTVQWRLSVNGGRCVTKTNINKFRNALCVYGVVFLILLFASLFPHPSV